MVANVETLRREGDLGAVSELESRAEVDEGTSSDWVGVMMEGKMKLKPKLAADALVVKWLGGK